MFVMQAAWVLRLQAQLTRQSVISQYGSLFWARTSRMAICPKSRKSWLTVSAGAMPSNKVGVIMEGQVGRNKILDGSWQMQKLCKELVVLIVCCYDVWPQSTTLFSLFNATEPAVRASSESFVAIPSTPKYYVLFYFHTTKQKCRSSRRLVTQIIGMTASNSSLTFVSPCLLLATVSFAPSPSTDARV